MPYLKSLSRELKEMWTLVLLQHQKSLTALLTLDKDLAREIILVEERVNSCEQFIESDFEHYISLRGSQELNISFAMFILKTARHLEIIGDLANNIANDVLNTSSTDLKDLVTRNNIQEAFTRSNRIMELTLQAFEDNDASLAKVAVNRIAICKEMVADSIHSLAGNLKFHPRQHAEALTLFSVLEGLTRTLEVTESISHGIIKYREVAAIQV